MKTKIFKRFLCILMAVMMVCVITACSSSASSDNGSTAGTEETDAPEADDPNLPEADDATETDDATVDDESTDNMTDEEKMARLEELRKKHNIGGYSDEQKQACFDSIAEEITKGYLEPNGISPDDLVWPEYGDEVIDEFGYTLVDEDLAWTYFYAMWSNYALEGKKFDSSPMEVLPKKQETIQLMNAVFAGIVNWYELPENITGHAYHAEEVFEPAPEVIPANVHFK